MEMRPFGSGDRLRHGELRLGRSLRDSNSCSGLAGAVTQKNAIGCPLGENGY